LPLLSLFVVFYLYRRPFRRFCQRRLTKSNERSVDRIRSAFRFRNATERRLLHFKRKYCAIQAFFRISLLAVKIVAIRRVSGFDRNVAIEKVRVFSLLLNPNVRKADLTVATVSNESRVFSSKIVFRNRRSFLAFFRFLSAVLTPRFSEKVEKARKPG